MDDRHRRTGHRQVAACSSVGQSPTLWVMSAREHVTVRLSPDGMARIRELANAETEGNVSMMTRRLLTEALTAREAQKRAPQRR